MGTSAVFDRGRSKTANGTSCAPAQQAFLQTGRPPVHLSFVCGRSRVGPTGSRGAEPRDPDQALGNTAARHAGGASRQPGQRSAALATPKVREDRLVRTRVTAAPAVNAASAASQKARAARARGRATTRTPSQVHKRGFLRRAAAQKSSDLPHAPAQPSTCSHAFRAHLVPSHFVFPPTIPERLDTPSQNHPV